MMPAATPSLKAHQRSDFRNAIREKNWFRWDEDVCRASFGAAVSRARGKITPAEMKTKLLELKVTSYAMSVKHSFNFVGVGV